MNASSSRDYLEQRVKTASSAQLHLMLIDGAMKFARQADMAYEANDEVAASQPLLRAMDIVSELLAGVKHSTDEINTKLGDLYRFIFTRMTMAYVNTDRAMLAEAMNVLEVNRETWRLACEKLATDDQAEESQAAETATKPAAPVRGPHKPVSLPSADLLAGGGGLSLEA